MNKSSFLRLILASLPLSLLATPCTLVYATCEPAGTPGDDVITCTGLDTSGVDAGAGNDSIHVQPDADVAIDTGSNYQPVLELGTGNDDVHIDGAVTTQARDTEEGNDEGIKAETDITASSAARGVNSQSDLLVVEIGEGALLDVSSDVSAEADAAALGIPFVTGEADATASASTSARGIWSRDDLAVTNRGSIIVRANGPDSANEAEADAPSTGVEGDAKSTATATSSAHADGITALNISNSAGSTNSIENLGLIDIYARTDSEADGPAIAASGITPLPPTSFSTTAESYISASASVYAAGINVLEGGSRFDNNGDIFVTAVADAEADALADSTNFQIIPIPPFVIPLPVYAYSDATATANANSWGFLAGPSNTGNHFVTNTGSISVSAEAQAFANADSVLKGISLGFDADATAIAHAAAIGIGTGTGNDNIVNEGSIVVHAMADGDAQARIEGIAVDDTLDLSATAIAILADAGDDIIVNRGLIDASVTCDHGCTKNVLAIDAGTGDDQVTLVEGSQTNGTVAMQEGVDVLSIDGAANLTGDLDGGAGIDTLAVQRTGEITTGILGFERVIKLQPGTFRIADLPTTDYLEVDEGILTLGNTYTMASGGDYLVRINPDGSDNRLNIETGIASLDGNLHVARSPGLFLDGDTFDIITAPSINGGFASEGLPEPTPLLSFSMVQLQTSVEVVVSTKPFSSVAVNRVERAVGNYLDAIAPTATGDLWNVLGEFQQLPTSGFETAFSSLSPDSYGGSTLASYSVARAYNRGLQQHLYSRRVLDTKDRNTQPVSLLQQMPVMVASNAGNGQLSGSLEGVSEYEKQSGHGLWLDAYGLRGNMDDNARYNWNDGGYTGFDFSTFGITLGYDRQVNDRVVAGLGMGYAKTNIDLDDNAGDGDIDSAMVSLYGEYRGERAYLDAILTYGQNNYDNKRNLTIGSIRRNAHSDHDGTVFSAWLGSGFPFYRQHWQLEPFLELQYIHLDEDGFTESGAGDVNLEVDNDKTESLVSEAGIRAAYTVQQKTGKLITDMGVAWVHDFDIDNRVITASYAGAPSTAFSVKGRDIDTNGVALDLGLAFRNKQHLTTSIRLGAVIQDNYTDTGVMGQVRYEF